MKATITMNKAEDGDADNMRDFFSLDDDIPEEEQEFHSCIRDQTIITQYA